MHNIAFEVARLYSYVGFGYFTRSVRFRRRVLRGSTLKQMLVGADGDKKQTVRERQWI